MNREAPSASPLDAIVSLMLGLPAWGVKQGHGSFLTFEFGQPTLEVRDGQWKDGRLRRTAHVHGWWHLWIKCCRWRALQDGVQLAWSEDTNELIGHAAASLNRQKLVAVKIDPGGGCSTFTFDLGGSLETGPYGHDPTDEQWIILSETDAFAYRADGFYKREPREMPPDEERWLPLG